MTNDRRLAKFSQFQCRCSVAHLPDMTDQPTMLDVVDSCDALSSWILSEDEHVSQDSKSFSWDVEDGAASDEDSDAEQKGQMTETPKHAPRTVDGVDLRMTAPENMVQRVHTPTSGTRRTTTSHASFVRQSSPVLTVQHTIVRDLLVERPFLEPSSPIGSSV